MEEGIAEFNAGHYDKALGLFGAAEPTNFNDPVFHYYMGSALIKLNHKPDAIKQFKLALDLEPTGQVADYCKKALENLSDPKTKGPGGKGDAAIDSQTPHIFSAECGCPLCDRLDAVLNDVRKVYRERLVITRCVQVGKNSWIPHEDAAKNLAIMDRYHVNDCPTLLFFSDEGTLVARMSGPMAESDVWKQVQNLTLHTKPSSITPAGDPKVDAMRMAIMRESEAKLNDSKNLEEQELRQLDTRLEQDRADLFGVRGAWNQISQLQSECERRKAQIRSDFQKRRQQIIEDAKSRADSLSR
jgi:tetratricopeptide (TPR) repeat protein